MMCVSLFSGCSSDYYVYLLAEGIYILAGGLQCTIEYIFEPIKYICIFLNSMNRGVELALSVCAQIDLLVPKLSC